ncbi:uncharacterized protein LOC132934365 isoform X1 [Metopolophium dirhodum]|uniref:uncharacterized protein LOC132934365 isoform X1 n=1 Tax=Metopolophium dirhodum TaxID=44670 RepID=UPI00298F80B9|nr:uncharacterized protein LOC132934365 isoform X1 [Metopolophium dirhodum]
MANNRKLIKLLLVVNIVYICIGFTSTRSPSLHQNKKLANKAEEVQSVEAEAPEVSEAGENNDEPNDVPPENGRLNMKRRPNGCPYCDSSVYSYCSDKLLHDACCCLDPHDTDLPNECQFADCSFLHSNTCREHRLITACCCNQFLAHKK